MKVMIVEDDYITSQVMKEILINYGDCDIAEDGLQAINLFTEGLIDGFPYDLIFLDIMMPGLDGQETLTRIRGIEREFGITGLDGVKIVMTTALDDFDNIKKAFHSQCEGYIVKPVEKEKIVQKLIELGFLDG